MIGYWHNPVVCPSVRLSVYDAVHCGSQGRCTGLKVVPAVLQADKFLFVHSDNCGWIYHLATKRTAEKGVTDRDAAITTTSVKNRNQATMSFLADRTAAPSAIGHYSSS